MVGRGFESGAPKVAAINACGRGKQFEIEIAFREAQEEGTMHNDSTLVFQNAKILK
jgi:hypothetical protein